MDEEELQLSGGNVSTVVRVGNTVRRTLGPWSPTVHELLRHLESRGFSEAPRFLGIDERGREVLTFIDGEIGNYPLKAYMWSDEVLQEVAHLLRRFHDATIDFVPTPGASWQFEYPDATQHEVICHNDVAPYNMVYVTGRPTALIDFDTAGPGPRLWDVTHAAYRFVPLLHIDNDVMRQAGLTNPTQQSRRLKLFCSAYGLTQPRAVLDMLEPRLQAMCTTIIELATSGNAAFQRMLAEGHLQHYQQEIKALHRYHGALEQAL
ncbi:MAG TPA: aminoglycoside phosphotransferase family protein [Ktedonobacteraceae bacterium]|nr:aminoglycoside phosphotransferase family protein [Ktedonobacteraceae bacterium]